MLENAFYPAALFPDSRNELLQHQETAVVQTPEKEGHVGSVPDTGAEEDDKFVDNRPHSALPVAAQRNVEVFLEPAREGHVPSAPEFPDASGDIGIIKVLLKVEAKHLSEADGHIAVAAEIKVNLQHIGDGSDPGCRRVKPRDIRCKKRVCHEADGVGNQHLFGETGNKTADSVHDAVHRLSPVLDLLGDIVVFHDGAGDELREEGNVEKHFSEILLGLSHAPVNVDDVGHGLEGEKGNSDGKPDGRHRNRRAKNGVEGLCQEAGVFKEHQHTQIQNHVDGHDRFFPGGLFLNEKGREVIDKSGGDHQKYINRFSIGIKHQACQKEHPVLCPDSRKNQVKQENHGQKDTQKYHGTENHCFCTPYFAMRPKKISLPSVFS